MPNLDKTGPRGGGPKTGRGNGQCDPKVSPQRRVGMGLGNRQGRGLGLGLGRKQSTQLVEDKK